METLTASVAPLKPPREWFQTTGGARAHAADLHRRRADLRASRDLGHLSPGLHERLLLRVREGTAVEDQATQSFMPAGGSRRRKGT